MPTIDVLTERVEPVAPSASAGEVFARFEREPDTLVIPVVEGERPVGLIERGDFLARLAGPLGQSLYGSRDVAHVMDPEPAVVEAGVRIDAFSDIILKSGPGALMRGFIVTRDGAYRGIGTAVALLREVNNQQKARLAEQAGQLRALSDISRQTAAAAQAKNRFMNLLNRELRAPLNGVAAVADLLGRQPLNAAAKAHVQTIAESSEAALQLLQDALDLARAEAGELELNSKATPLRPIMDDITACWTARAEQDGVRLLVSYEGDTELSAMLDEDRFRHVFNSLIGGAMRFARNGIIEVGLRAQVVGGDIRLEARVRDDGASTEPGYAHRLVADPEGAGDMAMAVSKRVIDSLGGKLWAEDNEGRGATYGFDVIVRRAELETESPSNVAQLNKLDLQGRPHVLIADDNATNRVVAQALCEMFGCTSETVEDGRQALEAVQAGRFDLVLMDIKMPHMDGVQATLAIRSLAAPAGAIPIIALTANADPDDATQYIAAGMACVVEKPIKPERLRLAMNKALGQEPVETAAKSRSVA